MSHIVLFTDLTAGTANGVQVHSLLPVESIEGTIVTFNNGEEVDLAMPAKGSFRRSDYITLVHDQAPAYLSVEEALANPDVTSLWEVIRPLDGEATHRLLNGEAAHQCRN